MKGDAIILGVIIGSISLSLFSDRDSSPSFLLGDRGLPLGPSRAAMRPCKSELLIIGPRNNDPARDVLEIGAGTNQAPATTAAAAAVEKRKRRAMGAATMTYLMLQ